jgi:hypothetical protein
MHHCLVLLVIMASFALGLTSTCFGQQRPIWSPPSGVYVYGPPTRGQSTSTQFYPKNWRGPRYTYPQSYYFKFPPFRRPVKMYAGNGPIGTWVLDQTFFSGATTNAEIWAIRRKGEVANLPDSARRSLPAHTRLVPVVGPLPKRGLSQGTFERTRPPLRPRAE